MHFVNKLIKKMTDKFQIQHRKTIPYHPQESGSIEYFNNVLDHTLTKSCNKNHYDWDHKISAVLWDYHMTCKNLTGHTPFILVYGKEVVMPIEYIVPSLRIAAIIEMKYAGAIE